MPRLRFKFSKEDPVRFLSHLDLMKTFERAVRRADIPIAFSEGFNPHPKMNFASALAVGVTSDDEYLDMELQQEVDLKQIMDSFDRALPPGIRLKEAKFVPEGSPALMAEVNRATYIVQAPMEGSAEEDLQELINRFMNSGDIMITKRTKKGPRQKNIRPGIIDFSGQHLGEQVKFQVSVGMSNEGNVRPEEVVCAFKEYSGFPIDCGALNIRRTRLFVEKNGGLIDPMEV